MFCPILLSQSPSSLPAWVHTALNVVKLFLRFQYSCSKLCQVSVSLKGFSTAFIKKIMFESQLYSETNARKLTMETQKLVRNIFKIYLT